MSHLILCHLTARSTHFHTSASRLSLLLKMLPILLKITAKSLLSIFSAIVFFFFDFLDFILCISYRCIDQLFEGNKPSCYCKNQEEGGGESVINCGNRENELSETLYKRNNFFRKIGGINRRLEDYEDKGDHGVVETTRWSDCGCHSCVSWISNADQKLHLVVKQVSRGTLFHKLNFIFLKLIVIFKTYPLYLLSFNLYLHI